MPSPFPGMDPWLESPALFPSLHTGFIGRLSALLNSILPEPFVAALTTRVYMESFERLIEPDVDILRSSFEPGPIATGPNRAAATPSLLLEVPRQQLPNDEITEIAIDIRTYDETERLITSIEVLSRSNKTRGTSGRGLYLAKQHELQSAGVNPVEIDLLRAGVHTTAVNASELRRLSNGYDYHVSIARAERWESVFVAAIPLDQRLPAIPIPLVEGVPDVLLDLQLAFEQTYDESRYARRVRYTEPCIPRLTPDQQAWAEAVLRDKKIIPLPPVA